MSYNFSCTFRENKFGDFVSKYRNRKTVPKHDAIDLMFHLVKSCEYPLHMPACYMQGDTPTTLSQKSVEENRMIEKFNEHLKDIIKELKNNL